MRKWMWIGAGTGAAAAIASLAVPVGAEQRTGAQAAEFSARDADGKVVKLSDFRGKTVVLEWNNPGCPYVQKHYNSGNMQKTQAAAVAQGAVWLTINSGAPGMQGHMNGAQAKQFVSSMKAHPSDYLLDPQGLVGKAYGAKTTPHMYIIDGSGKLVYQGGIDDRPTADLADAAKAKNYVLTALGEMKAGKPVSTPETRAYGCTVKYAT